jgi:hypothetical protein
MAFATHRSAGAPFAAVAVLDASSVMYFILAAQPDKGNAEAAARTLFLIAQVVW